MYVIYTGVDEVYQAVRDGILKRPENCEWCGSSKWIHGHHENYEKPLEVVWLCAKCHSARHRMFLALTGTRSIRDWQWRKEQAAQ